MAQLIPKVFPLLEQAIETGARRAINKFWKYSELARWAPEHDEHLQDKIEQYVMEEILEAFDIQQDGIEG